MTKRIIALLAFFMLFLSSMPVFAGTSVDIELANAKTIVGLDEQVSAASAAIKSPPAGADSARLMNDLKAAQARLDSAVKSAYGGTTSNGVAKAKKIDQTSKSIVDIEAQLNKVPPPDKALRDALSVALESEKMHLQNDLSEASEALRLKNIADQRIAGFNFGVALGVTLKAGERSIVNSASLDPNGIVRINQDNNTTANLILESHYFFTPDASIWNVEPKNWGHGPFIAIQPGTDNIIQSVGAGWMIGFKRSSIAIPDLARDRGDSFNIGMGVMLNPNAQVLGDGIQKDQPLPTGETAIRLKKTTEIGYLITFSYSF